jgi:UDP-N-acetylmuramoyl-tripeptide--D-alanyl-D-alanine ligase
MEIHDLHRIFLHCGTVITDTRKITPGCLFVALKGDRFDANEFAEEAIKAGAAYALIDNPNFSSVQGTILVNNTLASLQQLAKYHRQYLSVPIIALTGSNGKTTTKELIQAVLKKRFRVKATVGNLNNHIGVPLTLLNMDLDTEMGIVEMGANHQKEIEFLCNIALPDYGYITNFGKAHLEGFGGYEGVIKGKSEMYDHLRANGKTAFINNDDELQREKAAGIKSVTFGTKAGTSDVVIKSVEANPFVSVTVDETIINSNMIGIYNAANINVAITIGLHFEVPLKDIKNAIEGYSPDNNRSQLTEKGSNKIILDAYNANPSSMRAALTNFNQLTSQSKIAFLGDMFELGEESLAEHRAIAEYAGNMPDINFYLVGHDFEQTGMTSNNITTFPTFEDLKTYMQSYTPSNSHILIKGSRGMALERILDLI